VTFESLPVVRNHTRLGSTLALESRTTSPERARWHQRQRSCTGVLKHGATLQSISGYMRSSYMTCHITGGFSLPEGARERSIHLFADDRVARGHLIGQILQVW